MNKSLLLAALFALSIAACSKTEKPAEPAPAPAAAPAAEAPAAAPVEAAKDAAEAVKDAATPTPAADAAKK